MEEVRVVQVRTTACEEEGSHCCALVPLAGPSAAEVSAALALAEREFPHQLGRHGGGAHHYPHAWVALAPPHSPAGPVPTAALDSGGAGDGEPSGRAAAELQAALATEILPHWRLTGALVVAVLRLPQEGRAPADELAAKVRGLARRLLASCHEAVVHRRLQSLVRGGRFCPSVAASGLADQLLIERSVRTHLLEPEGAAADEGEAWGLATPSGLKGRVARSALELLLPPELLERPPTAEAETEFGAHRVVRLGEVFYKVGVGGFVADNYIVKGSEPIFPAYEFMSNALCRIAIGPQGPETQLVLLQKRGAEHLQVGVMASKAVQGVSLDRVWMICDELAGRIDAASYTDAVLNALLTFPNDAKPDNYLLEVVEVASPPPGQQRSLEHIRRLRLTPLDNDRSCIAPALGRIGGKGAAGHTVLGMRCFLFMMQELARTPLAPSSAARFLRRTPLEVAALWLRRLHSYDEWLRGAGLTEESERFWGLPVRVTAGTAERVFRRLAHMQTLMREEGEALTHERLWEECEPVAAAVYRHVRGEAEERAGGPLSRMEEVMAFLDPEHANLYQRIPCVEEALPEVAKQHRAELEAASLPTNLYDNLDSMADLATVPVAAMAAELLAAVDFSRPAHVGPSGAAALLVVGRCLPFASSMRLANCGALDDAHLLALAQGSGGWQELSLEGCPGVTPAAVAGLLAMPQHAHLRLEVRDCTGLLSAAALPALAAHCKAAGAELVLRTAEGAYCLAGPAARLPLHAAAAAGDEEAAALLLAANLGTRGRRDQEGNGPLHLAAAAAACTPALIDLLLTAEKEAGAALLEANAAGRSVLEEAAALCRSRPLFEHLLARSGCSLAEAEARRQGPRSLLQCAVGSANATIVAALLEAGAAAQLQSPATAAAVLADLPRDPRDATSRQLVELLLEQSSFPYLAGFASLEAAEPHFLHQQLAGAAEGEEGRALQSMALLALARLELARAAEEAWGVRCDLEAAAAYLAAAARLAPATGAVVYRALLQRHQETVLLVAATRARLLLAAAAAEAEEEEEDALRSSRDRSTSRGRRENSARGGGSAEVARAAALAPLHFTSLPERGLPLARLWAAAAVAAGDTTEGESEGEDGVNAGAVLAERRAALLEEWVALFADPSLAGASPVPFELVGVGGLATGYAAPHEPLAFLLAVPSSLLAADELLYLRLLRRWVRLLAVASGQARAPALERLGLECLTGVGLVPLLSPCAAAAPATVASADAGVVAAPALAAAWEEGTTVAGAPTLYPGFLRRLAGARLLAPSAAAPAALGRVLLETQERMEELLRLDEGPAATCLEDLWWLLVRPHRFLAHNVATEAAASAARDLRLALAAAAEGVARLFFRVGRQQATHVRLLALAASECRGCPGVAPVTPAEEAPLVHETAPLWATALRLCRAIERCALSDDTDALLERLGRAFAAEAAGDALAHAAEAFAWELVGSTDQAVAAYDAAAAAAAEGELAVDCHLGVARLYYRAGAYAEAFKQCDDAAAAGAKSGRFADFLAGRRHFAAGLCSLAKSVDGNPILTVTLAVEKFQQAADSFAAAGAKLATLYSGVTSLLTGGLLDQQTADPLLSPLDRGELECVLLRWQRRTAAALMLAEHQAAAASMLKAVERQEAGEERLLARQTTSGTAWRRATVAGTAVKRRAAVVQ